MQLEFRSFGELARHVTFINVLHNTAVDQGLWDAAKIVHKTLKPMFGNYQSGAGPFATWEPLKPQTIDDRINQGFPPDEPLLRTGELRDSYEVKHGQMWAGVGSELEKALVQEVGDPTHNLPARSTLGIAFVRSEREAFEKLLVPVAALYVTGRLSRVFGVDI